MSPCPYEDQHTDTPAGYLSHAEWMAEMSVTHVQRQCPGCLLWTIWEPKQESAE